MFRYAKNVRLVSFLQQAFQMALTGFLPVSLWLSMALCDSHSGSHWLSLPLSGILWPSLAHYCSLISRIQPLIGSQGPCSALIADATMTHFLPLCSIVRGQAHDGLREFYGIRVGKDGTDGSHPYSVKTFKRRLRRSNHIDNNDNN